MDEEQISMLKKALALYSFTIDQRRESSYDPEASAFYRMVDALSEKVGVDLTDYD